MFIPNPWPHFPSTRCVCKPGDIAVMIATRGDIEVPDGTTEALLTPVKMKGRGKYEEVGPSRIWSEEFGLLDVEDHVKKLEIKGETAKLQDAQKQASKRKLEEYNQAEDEERAREAEALREEEEEARKVDEAKILAQEDYEFDEDGTEDEA